ncbi:MAG: CHAT domain-containing protein, partial [Promethearchaeia archaeon]
LWRQREAAPVIAASAAGNEPGEMESVDAELKGVFEKHGLVKQFTDTCTELGIDCLDDLKYVKPELITDLSWLKPVQQQKLTKLVQAMTSSSPKALAASAQAGASSVGVFQIEGFFCKRNADKGELLRQIQALKRDDAMDSDERQHRIQSLEEEIDLIETIDVHKEAQSLMALEDGRSGLKISVHAQPTLQHFEDRMLSAQDRKTRGLHLAGHGRKRCGFLWLKSGVAAREYEEVPIARIVRVVSTEVATEVAGVSNGTIEFAMLNGCETEEMGRQLRNAGLRHVVCWRSEVQDTTARRFALDFYGSLDQQAHGH